MHQTSPVDSISSVQGVGYSSGNFGKNILWNSLEFCLLYLLTDVMLVDPAMAGLVITVSIFWDALLDPILGYVADRTATPIGKYGPFIIFGSPICSALFIAIFMVPLIRIQQELTVLIICLLLFRTFYTVVDIPHNALLARITHTEEERSRLAGLRFFFSCLGSLVVAFSLAPILSSTSPGGEAANFFKFSIAAGLLSTLFLIGSWWSVRKIDITLARSRRTQFLPIKALPGIAKSRYFAVLLAAIFVTGLTTPLFTKMFLYYAKYSLGIAEMSSFGLSVFLMGAAAGSFLWIWGARKLGSKNALQYSHGLLSIMGGAFFLLDPDNLFIFSGILFLAGLGAAGAYLLIWVLASNAVDDVEALTGNRFEATLFALLILTMKAAIGIGSTVAGLLLKQGGYQALESQTQTTEFVIRLAMFGIPAAGSLIIVGILALPCMKSWRKPS
jgi:GPH family glycoside/pentoside/hexuronide:cation symporter